MPELVAGRTEEKPAEGGRKPCCWLSVGWGREMGNGRGVVFRTLFRLSEEEARNFLGLEASEFSQEPVRVLLKMEIREEGFTPRRQGAEKRAAGGGGAT